MPFLTRFEAIYGECAVSSPPPGAGPVLRCSIRNAAGGWVSVDFESPQPLALFPSALLVFEPQGVREVTAPFPGWRAITCRDQPGVIAMRHSEIRAEVQAPWRRLAGAIALHGTLRLGDVLPFHAAVVAIAGRGVLLMGPSLAGKTTLALALAERGHPLLSDDVAPIDVQAGMVFPFRRRVGLREGPRTPGMEQALADGRLVTAETVDGSLRAFARPAHLFPGVEAEPVSAGVCVFMTGFGPQPELERFTVGLEALSAATPFESTLWPPDHRERARNILNLVRFLGNIPCYHLTSGPLLETADRIERLMGETSV